MVHNNNQNSAPHNGNASTDQSIGINHDQFRRLSEHYHERWGVHLLAVQSDGKAVFAPDRCRGCRVDNCQAASMHVMLECLRWGECSLYERQSGKLRWGVPLMVNEIMLGGIVACVEEEQALPDDDTPALDLREAMQELRELVEQANLTNRALLAARRAECEQERRRAEAIHEVKVSKAGGILELYLREEPSLISAIRQGARQEAIAILNRILVQIYHVGQGDLDLLKSFILELVVAMSRAVVEAGGPPSEALGANYASLAELGQIDSEEGLSRWLVGILNRLMDTIRRTTRRTHAAIVRDILDYIQDHYNDPITRDDAARGVFISPSLFSHLLKQHTGRSFSEHLNQVRVDRASELLRRTDMSLSQIAQEVGFSDQSYFTKVFRSRMNTTPRVYRLKLGG